MRRTWTWLLAAALLAVLAGLAWWWVGRSAWRPPTPIRPALPDIALVQDGAAVQVKAALDSPLLWSSRAPVETPEAAPEKAPESELAQLRLMAVLAHPDQAGPGRAGPGSGPGGGSQRNRQAVVRDRRHRRAAPRRGAYGPGSDIR